MKGTFRHFYASTLKTQHKLKTYTQQFQMLLFFNVSNSNINKPKITLQTSSAPPEAMSLASTSLRKGPTRDPFSSLYLHTCSRDQRVLYSFLGKIN